MKETLSIRMVNALLHGKNQLGEEAQRRIRSFIRSQQLENGSFKDKNGQSDLYYTAFGWLLCYVFGLPIPRTAKHYLNTLPAEQPDLVYCAAYVRCRLLYRLLTRYRLLPRRLQLAQTTFLSRFHPFIRFSTRLCSIPLNLATINSYPHDDPDAPYSLFVRLSLLEDAGKRIPNPHAWLETLRSYRTLDGGFSNLKTDTGNGTTSGTNTNTGSGIAITSTVNATAAALCVLGQLDSDEAGHTADFLLSRQHASGGFAASPDAPLPDLLSTATALFALAAKGRKPGTDARGFIEAHWNEHTGGFSATLFDETSDIEYTFYGMLALGTL